MTCPQQKRLLGQIIHDQLRVGPEEPSREPSVPHDLACIPLALVCTAVVLLANLQPPPAPPLPTRLKEVPDLGELDHISTSLTELLFVPAGFSFPQLTVTLLHVLQSAPWCTCHCDH